MADDEPKGHRVMAYHRIGSSWAQTLNPAQRATCSRLIALHNGTSASGKKSGWTVYMTPTVGEPKYLELRHRFAHGGMARWVIERDGTVSASDDLGVSRDLIPWGTA